MLTVPFWQSLNPSFFYSVPDKIKDSNRNFQNEVEFAVSMCLALLVYKTVKAHNVSAGDFDFVKPNTKMGCDCEVIYGGTYLSRFSMLSQALILSCFTP